MALDPASSANQLSTSLRPTGGRLPALPPSVPGMLFGWGRNPSVTSPVSGSSLSPRTPPPDGIPGSSSSSGEMSHGINPRPSGGSAGPPCPVPSPSSPVPPGSSPGGYGPFGSAGFFLGSSPRPSRPLGGGFGFP